MPEPSSANRPGAAFTASQKLLLLGLNGLPLLHLLVVSGVCLYAPQTWRWPLAMTSLYLLPPLLARVILTVWHKPQGKILVGSPAFFVWWAVLQVQMLFVRLPQLEEILRLLPGVYTLWLRLWGARIGRLTFWSPGTTILDRSYLVIGDDVILGAGVRINPHVLTKNAAGQAQLLLATVTIGDRARVGGYSLLTAGTAIAADEETHAMLILPPFSVWKHGKRVRPPEESQENAP